MTTEKNKQEFHALMNDALDGLAQENGYASWQSLLDSHDEAVAGGYLYSGPNIQDLTLRAQAEAVSKYEPEAMDTPEVIHWRQRLAEQEFIESGQEPSHLTVDTLPDEVLDTVAGRHQAPVAPRQEDFTAYMNSVYAQEPAPSTMVEPATVEIDDAVDRPTPRSWFVFVLAGIIGCCAVLLSYAALASDQAPEQQTIINECVHCDVIHYAPVDFEQLTATINDSHQQLAQNYEAVRRLQGAFAAAEDQMYTEFEEMGGGVAGAYAVDSIAIDPNGGWQIGFGGGTFRGEFFAAAAKVGGPLGEDAFFSAGVASDGKTLSGAVGVTIKLGAQYLPGAYD